MEYFNHDITTATKCKVVNLSPMICFLHNLDNWKMSNSSLLAWGCPGAGNWTFDKTSDMYQQGKKEVSLNQV